MRMRCMLSCQVHTPPAPSRCRSQLPVGHIPHVVTRHLAPLLRASQVCWELSSGLTSLFAAASAQACGGMPHALCSPEACRCFMWLHLQVVAEAVVLEEPLGEKEPLLVELQARRAAHCAAGYPGCCGMLLPASCMRQRTCKRSLPLACVHAAGHAAAGGPRHLAARCRPHRRGAGAGTGGRRGARAGGAAGHRRAAARQLPSGAADSGAARLAPAG